MLTLHDFVGALWGFGVMWVVLACGLFLTVSLRGVQFRRLSHAVARMLGSRSAGDNTGQHVNAFQAFCTGLASRVGSGNLAGVAIAITHGGPGAVVWMWLVCILGMATSLTENSLAQAFKERRLHHDTGELMTEGAFVGGAAYYMRAGLKMEVLPRAFAGVFLVGTLAVAVQSNSVAQSLEQYHVPAWGSGVGLAVLCAAVLLGGVHSVVHFAEAVVPFMAVGYLAVAIAIVLLNVHKLPFLLGEMFACAFGFRQAAGGATILAAMTTGCRRGVFSNEAGMGTSPNAASLSSPYPPHPITQGMLSMLGVSIDTIVVCSCTAFIVLLADVDTTDQSESGIKLTAAAMEFHLGWIGPHLITAVLFCFAFTTVVAAFAYAEANLLFLTHALWAKRALMAGFLVVVYGGAVLDMEMAWEVCDLLMAISTCLNLYALVRLRAPTVALLHHYEAQVDAGDPVPRFFTDALPFFDHHIRDRTVWPLQREDSKHYAGDDNDDAASDNDDNASNNDKEGTDASNAKASAAVW